MILILDFLIGICMTIDVGGLCFIFIHRNGEQYYCFRSGNYPDYRVVNDFLETIHRLGIDDTYEIFLWDFQ